MSEERAVLANDLSLFPAHQAAHAEQSETLDETRGHPGRALFHLPGKMESADLRRHPARRHDLCAGFPPFEFAAVNAIYARYFPKPPARIFVAVPAWPGPLDVEIDCIAAS
jgi:hypothetical protein